jgi:homoserine dehydrogenase
MKRKLKIGLFGFGCVGQGLYDILCKNDHFNSEVVGICVKDRNKKRTLPPEMFVYDKWEILNNDDLDLIIEMISDTEEAYKIVTAALKKGKKVISASKKMIAQNFEALYTLQKQYHCSFLYEAACCGSIPIIRNLEEYFDNEPLKSVYGIFNGSSNYILSKVYNENLSYSEALKQAQELGFAELDPTLDVGGYDAANKLSIIIAHAFGTIVPPDQIFTYGIQNLHQAEMDFAKERKLKIRMQAKAVKTSQEKLAAFVIPTFVDVENPLYYVENELNTTLIEGRFSGQQQFKGKGAGGHPTGSAILSDISASLYHYKYEYKKMEYHENIIFDNDIKLKIYIRYRSKESLSALDINHIHLQAKHGDYQIAFAEANLQNLAEFKDQLSHEDIFIADLSNLKIKLDSTLSTSPSEYLQNV